MGDRTDDHGMVHSCETVPPWPDLDVLGPDRAELEDFEPSTGHLHGCPLMAAPAHLTMRQSNPGCDCARKLYEIAQDRTDTRWLLTDDERGPRVDRAARGPRPADRR